MSESTTEKPILPPDKAVVSHSDKLKISSTPTVILTPAIIVIMADVIIIAVVVKKEFL